MTIEARMRAAKFAEAWDGETYERGEAQTFWNEFFEIFGRSRRAVALFELYAKKIHGYGFIDLFWPGKLIVEHKSMGRSLTEALTQAEEYVAGLPDDHIPRYMLVCDFTTFHLVDLDRREEHRFTLAKLHDNVGLFGFMTDQPVDATDVDPVNQKATAIMGKIYESVAETGYPASDMERLLTRLAFCMFADDAGILEHGLFRRWLEEKTTGYTLGPMLTYLFQMLDTPKRDRLATTDPMLAAFEYINGALFRDHISTPAFTDEVRRLMIEADGYDWSKVNPAIFGSMFQVVLDKESRRRAGAHYTTEENIMRVLKPLFLDDLRDEFEEAMSGMNRRALLERFQNKLASLTFLDPACGSGNFLAIAYREIRRLEHQVILELHDTSAQRLDIAGLSKVNVHQFYGIEINPFSVLIAEISLWMTDHLMNLELGAKYGLAYARIPLKESPNIVCADALEMDWNDVLPAERCLYILGNPPYGGSKVMTARQRGQVKKIADLGKTGGTLDYVTAWFFKAARYSESSPTIRIGFVATNSIVQGEQVGQLWPNLLDNYGLKIDFAYRSFKWSSEAPGMAHVHVVIIGLVRGGGGGRRRLFHIDGVSVLEENPKTISPYLHGAERARVVCESSSQLNNLPDLIVGSQTIMAKPYIFKDDEKDVFLRAEPKAEPYMRPYVGADELIRNERRWILALQGIKPDELMKLPKTKARVEEVKSLRLNSSRSSTVKLAETPTSYGITVMPSSRFLAIPATSSEKRKYVPIKYLNPPVIPNHALLIIPNADLGLFGLLTSAMHMIWLDCVGGRLETRYRYSAGMVYNTFPVPSSPLDALDPFAQAVLDARAAHPTSTLYDLYDPITMPPDLIKAHKKLDRKVERLYRREPFRSDDERIEFLLELYGKMVDDGN